MTALNEVDETVLGRLHRPLGDGDQPLAVRVGEHAGARHPIEGEMAAVVDHHGARHRVGDPVAEGIFVGEQDRRRPFGRRGDADGGVRYF